MIWRTMPHGNAFTFPVEKAISSFTSKSIQTATNASPKFRARLEHAPAPITAKSESTIAYTLRSRVVRIEERNYGFTKRVIDRNCATQSRKLHNLAIEEMEKITSFPSAPSVASASVQIGVLAFRPKHSSHQHAGAFTSHVSEFLDRA